MSGVRASLLQPAKKQVLPERYGWKANGVRDLDPPQQHPLPGISIWSEEESDVTINRCRILPMWLMSDWSGSWKMPITVAFIWRSQNPWWRPFFPNFLGILSFLTGSVGWILCLQRLWVPTQESEHFPSWNWSCVLFLSQSDKHFSFLLKDICNTVKCKPQIVFHFFWKTNFIFWCTSVEGLQSPVTSWRESPGIFCIVDIEMIFEICLFCTEEQKIGNPGEQL